MMNFTELPSAPSDRPVPFADPLRLAAAAYLARFKGSSREHTESVSAFAASSARSRRASGVTSSLTTHPQRCK